MGRRRRWEVMGIGQIDSCWLTLVVGWLSSLGLSILISGLTKP